MPINIPDIPSVREFIDSVKNHRCCQSPQITNWDRTENPSVFKIGFRCLSCGKVWVMGLATAKKNMKALPDGGLSLLLEYNELAKDKKGQILCDGFIEALIKKF